MDHGICLHHEDKLRTVLWGFRGEPLPAAAVDVLPGWDPSWTAGSARRWPST
ncbi:MAG TPA: hypothetical protein VGO16_01370 [Pseudonocardiaceae bacterium]|nr:hypothetical protein [Pseudonocardiaceae bacterium]